MFYDTGRYLREEQLEVQLWLSYSSELQKDSKPRPRHRDKLIGCTYIDLSPLCHTRVKRHRVRSDIKFKLIDMQEICKGGSFQWATSTFEPWRITLPKVCPGEGCAASSAASAPVMWCGDCGDMLGVFQLQLVLTFSKWSISTKQPYTWTHIVNSKVSVELFQDNAPLWNFFKAGLKLGGRSPDINRSLEIFPYIKTFGKYYVSLVKFDNTSAIIVIFIQTFHLPNFLSAALIFFYLLDYNLWIIFIYFFLFFVC